MTGLGRWGRGAVAAATLLGIVAGLPLSLVLWGTSPLRGGPGWDSLRDMFYELGSERVLVGALTIASWVVWVLFVRALILELVELRVFAPTACWPPATARPREVGHCGRWPTDCSRG